MKSGALGYFLLIALAAQAGYYQFYLAVGDFRRQRIFERLEPVETQPAAGRLGVTLGAGSRDC